MVSELRLDCELGLVLCLKLKREQFSSEIVSTWKYGHISHDMVDSNAVAKKDMYIVHRSALLYHVINVRKAGDDGERWILCYKTVMGYEYQLFAH